jgi:hypothetical protein
MANHPNRASHSGHLPAHVRDMFRQAIYAFSTREPGEPMPLTGHEIDHRQRQISIAEACGLVWNCTDILPGITVDELQDCLATPPVGDTYAAAAHAIMSELRASGMVDAEGDIARRRLYDARDAAWRDLESWFFTEQGSEAAKDPGRAWYLARGDAQRAVEEWRARPRQVVGTTKLEELLEAVAVAEEVIARRGLSVL